MRNDYVVRGETTVIFIQRRNGDLHEVLVDTADFEKINEIDATWSVSVRRKTFAVKTSRFYKNGKMVYETISLNRFLMDFPKDKEVSFANGNGLDCRRSNLRITTRAETSQNRKGPDFRRNHSTGVRNVSYYAKQKVFAVKIGKKVIGYYDNLIEAEEVAIKERELRYKYSTR